MPWEIRQGTSQCSGYGVFKEGTNELEGCHETKEKAQAQMAALYSTEEMGKAENPCWEGYHMEGMKPSDDGSGMVPNCVPNKTSKSYQGCGCPTCKSMDVACEDCPVCNPDMSKADSVRIGQMVSWNSSGGRARGKVKRIVRNGSYNVPDSDFTITGTEDNPAVVIELYRNGEPTGRMVGHRMSTLRAEKSFWSAFDPREVISKRVVI